MLKFRVNLQVLAGDFVLNGGIPYAATMTFLRLFPLLVALAVPQAVRASDFGAMAEPGFARWAFLSPERQLDILCVHYTNFAGRAHRGVTMAEAQLLRSAVTKRLASELGSRKWAIKALEPRERYDGREPDADYADMAGSCAAHLAALRDGTIEAKLAPLGGDPIALPDLDSCLAYDLLARRSDPPIRDSMFNDRELRDRLLGSTDDERKARAARAEAIAAAMPPLDRRRLEMIVSIGCIQAIIAANPNDTELDDAPEEPEAPMIDGDPAPGDGTPAEM